MNTISLYEISSRYTSLLMLDDPELPSEAISDTLEALEGEFEEKAKAVTAYGLNCKAQASLIDDHIKKMQAKSKALKNRDDAMRQYLIENMERCGISKIESPLFSATLKQGGSKSVVIDNPDSLPSDYTIEKVTLSPDKALIKKAINDGFEVPGAHIEVKNTLMIK